MGRAASISCSSTMGNKRADSELFRAAMQGVKRLAPAPLPPELPAAPSRKIAAADFNGTRWTTNALLLHVPA